MHVHQVIHVVCLFFALNCLKNGEMVISCKNATSKMQTSVLLLFCSFWLALVFTCLFS